MNSSNECETTQVQVKEFQCARCNDKGGFIVTKGIGETVRIKDVDGTLKEKNLKRPQELWQVCECEKIRSLNRMIKSSAITEEFQKMGFSNFDTSRTIPEIVRMKEIGMKYFKHFDQIKKERVNSCLFSGQPGSGKTHILTAISNNLMHKKQIPVLYFPYKDGMNNISANNYERKDKIIQQMKQVEVLFIDDLFKPIGGKLKNNYGWQVDIIFEVVNHRYLNKLPILVSTELDFMTMAEVDEALASRIFEMASDFTVTIPKNMIANYRLKKLKSS